MTDDRRHLDSPGRRASDIERALVLHRIERVESRLDAMTEAQQWVRRTMVNVSVGLGAAIALQIVSALIVR